MILNVFTHITRWLKINQWISLRLRRWSLTLGLSVQWVLLAASSRTRSIQDELDELWPLFSLGSESVDGIGVPTLCCWGSPRCDRLFFIRVHRFLFSRQRLRTGLILAHCPCFLHVSNYFRRDKRERKKGLRNVFGVSVDHIIVYLLSNAPCEKRTLRQHISNLLRISPEFFEFKVIHSKH